MELRLGDLYDLIARIVDDRLRHWRESAAAPDGTVPTSGMPTEAKNLSSTSAQGQLPQGQLLLQQLQELVHLQRQLLSAFQQHQQRSEALLEELKGLLLRTWEQQGGKLGNTSPSPKEPEAPSSAGDGFLINAFRTDKQTPAVEPTVFVPTAPAAEPPPAVTHQNWAELLPSHLRHRYGVQVNYLRERALPDALGATGVKVLIGEGTQNGQGVTLAALVKEQVDAADVGIFYNAIIKPLRASVAEPVIGIIIGNHFDPKATRVAYFHELITVKAEELTNVPQ